MNNLHLYQPHTIYTRLNDIFDEGNKKVQEDFAPENFIKPNLIGNLIEQNQKIKNKEIKKQQIINEENLKKRYVNTELVESWIGAIQNSKYIE